jgi:hypothetical protein
LSRLKIEFEIDLLEPGQSLKCPGTGKANKRFTFDGALSTVTEISLGVILSEAKDLLTRSSDPSPPKNGDSG